MKKKSSEGLLEDRISPPLLSTSSQLKNEVLPRRGSQSPSQLGAAD